MDVFDFVYDPSEDKELKKRGTKSWRRPTAKIGPPVATIQSPAKLIIKHREAIPPKSLPKNATNAKAKHTGSSTKPTNTRDCRRVTWKCDKTEDPSTHSPATPKPIATRETIATHETIESGTVSDAGAHSPSDPFTPPLENHGVLDVEILSEDVGKRRFLRSNYEGGIELALDEMFAREEWI
eukprot:TRINITY_DN1890_c0_g1_i6.p1 TRINITY_DN1890_c0_g1~~TRINITY_DN1890_c0_g1_i6.p1  ORF type:complete len:182 (+),score=39.93 TRINITY_DN1890_c0_g1_i6:73-618(+)